MGPAATSSRTPDTREARRPRTYGCAVQFANVMRGISAILVGALCVVMGYVVFRGWPWVKYMGHGPYPPLSRDEIRRTANEPRPRIAYWIAYGIAAVGIVGMVGGVGIIVTA